MTLRDLYVLCLVAAIQVELLAAEGMTIEITQPDRVTLAKTVGATVTASEGQARYTVRAEGVRVSDLLKELDKAGVHIRVEGQTDNRANVSVENAPYWELVTAIARTTDLRIVAYDRLSTRTGVNVATDPYAIVGGYLIAAKPAGTGLVVTGLPNPAEIYAFSRPDIIFAVPQADGSSRQLVAEPGERDVLVAPQWRIKEGIASAPELEGRIRVYALARALHLEGELGADLEVEGLRFRITSLDGLRQGQSRRVLSVCHTAPDQVEFTAGGDASGHPRSGILDFRRGGLAIGGSDSSQISFSSTEYTGRWYFAYLNPEVLEPLPPAKLTGARVKASFGVVGVTEAEFRLPLTQVNR